MSYLLDFGKPRERSSETYQYGLVPLLSKTGAFWGEERVFYLKISLMRYVTHFRIRGKKKRSALFSPHPSGIPMAHGNLRLFVHLQEF